MNPLHLVENDSREDLFVMTCSSVYGFIKPWTESGATWNSFDGSNLWTNAGGFDSADCDSSEIGSAGFTNSETAGTLKEISLPAAIVQEWVSGTTPNNGFLLKMDTEYDDMYGLASMNQATTTYQPKLVIPYTLPFFRSFLIAYLIVNVLFSRAIEYDI